MNLSEHRELWNKIEHFPLDEPGAVITFSKKLAAAQKWSAYYTERVIEEYRKFILLCCIAPKGASPSKAVDEAWHLHLTYTQSYWRDFCRNTLRRDIHHHPSKGGTQENHKHEEWYKETLDLYTSVFGTEPPSDIWPRPADQQDEIPEPQIIIRNEVRVLIAIIILLPFILIGITTGKIWPYSLRGDQFLVFFPLFALAMLGSFFILQMEKGRYYRKIAEEYFPSGITIFQAAKFLYGKHRAIQTGIVDLMRRSMLKVTNDKKFIIQNGRYYEPAKELNPLVPYLLKEEDGSTVNYEIISVIWYNDAAFSNPHLSKLYLFANKEEFWIYRYYLLLLVFVVGIFRIFQGWSTGHPVGFLFFEMFAFLIIAIIVRDIFGRGTLIQKRCKELYELQQSSQQLYSDQVVADFSVRGNQAIIFFSDGLLLTTLFAAYAPVGWSRSSSAASSGGCSSCGGGGCGGGGCGGGCGGCGGGD